MSGADGRATEGPQLDGTDLVLGCGARRELLTDSQLLAYIDRMLAAAVEVLDVDSVGLMLLDDRSRLRRVGATDDVADRLEHAQLDSGQGPGPDTVRTGRTVAITDLSAAGEYARLRRRLHATDIRAVLSSPVRVDQEPVGILNAVLSRPHAWSDSQLRANQAYADVIGLALKTFARARHAAGRVGRLQNRLTTLPRLSDAQAGEQQVTRSTPDDERTPE